HSLARQSTHPLARQIREALAGTEPALPIHDFSEVPGAGIQGRLAGRRIQLGSARWLEAPAAAGETNSSGIAGDQNTTVHLAVDGVYRGAFALSSALRPQTERLARELGGRYEIALLSGDNSRDRERFQTLFGGEHRLHFNQSPFDKLAFIRELQDSGRSVMMVGDGLNDAGALRQSDVGVAAVEKIGAFSPASDVILEASRVPQLADLLALARWTTRIVRAGFVISGLYNLAGISIAAAGILSPLICAVLMPVSSISVVLFACG